MLSFDQKRAIFSSFDELIEKRISNNRVNYVYPASKKRQKVVVAELHPSGNGYVCGKYLDGYPVDKQGWVKIKDFTEEELRTIVRKAIDSLSKP